MQKTKLNDPILIAAWPGMGQVAVTACYYLISKLEMEFHADYATGDLFDVDHVGVEAGLVQPFRYPKNQFFVWRNPGDGSDLLVFIGEAQPPQGRYNFCRKLIDYVQGEGVSKIFTFAAMATSIELTDDSRVIGVATNKATADHMLENEVRTLGKGTISGMNGILLGVAAERKIPGGCLLGEMPTALVNVPYPKASLAILDAFSRLTDTEIDVSELHLEVERMERYLLDAIAQLKRIEQQAEEGPVEPEESFIPDPEEVDPLAPEDRAKLEIMFEETKLNRSKAFELKRELDRLEVFREYEDRFLDLFQKRDDEKTDEDQG